MSEQSTYSSDPDDLDGQEGALDRVGEPSDVDVEAGDVETADAPREQSGDMYETPDDLGGTGGVDAGGAG